MRDQILQIVNNEDKALSVEEMLDRMSLSSVEEFKDLLKELNAMEDELLIYRTNKNKYMKFSNTNLKIGKMLGLSNSRLLTSTEYLHSFLILFSSSFL